jgi:hypothetical protein
MTDREKLGEIRAHLGAALAQTLPSDDQIIMEHVRESYELAGGEYAAVTATVDVPKGWEEAERRTTSTLTTRVDREQCLNHGKIECLGADRK